MIDIKLIDSKGAIFDVQANEGETLLQAAMNAGIDGFAAECGGCCVCATCHCYVNEADLVKIDAPTADELLMLDFTATQRKDTSRLACQVKLTDKLNGIEFFIPDRQY
jgi:2Fe-2S ferredoxin